MSGNVHQDDPTKLKTTATLAAGASIEVIQDTAADLNATVTQLAKDRTVTGTVTVTQATAANLNATVTQLAKDRTVTGTVAVSTLPNVTIGAALPAGTNAIGKLAANNGVDIGDVDVKSIAAGTNAIGKLAANSGVDIGDVTINNAAGAAAVNIQDGGNTVTVDGTVTTNKGDTAYTKVLKCVPLTTTDETTVWTPALGRKFVLTDIMISAVVSTAAQSITLRDRTGGTIILILIMNTGTTFASNLQTPYQSTTANNVLTAQAGAIAFYITVCGYEV